MASVGVPLIESHKEGFSFENCKRNERLAKLAEIIKPRKTGTTIVGMIFKHGIILGADTRATEGNIVAEKNCEKIHYISDNIYCCGAGTAADTMQVTNMVSSQMALHFMCQSRDRKPRVVTALRMLKQHLFKHQGYVGAALVLGGVDSEGPHLYTVAPHGSTDKLPYVTMGSGSLAAMSVYETRFKVDMELEEAVQLTRDAVASGIFNDLGSGSNIDLCIITKDKVDYLRPFEVANRKGERAAKYVYGKGTTPLLSKVVEKVEYERVSTRIIRDTPATETMDTA